MPSKPKISLFSGIQSSSFIKKSDELQRTRELQTNSFLENRNGDGLNASMEALSVKRNISAPEKMTDTSLAASTKTLKDINSNIDDDTPYKDFQIPAAIRRLQSSQHRTLLSSANQTKKCRSELEKEFKSQKVLFTTPSAVSRPKMNMPNTLDDSLNCFKSSPMVPATETSSSGIKHLPTVPEKENSEGRKSIDKTDGFIHGKDAAANNSSKQKVLRINGKDFIIRERIGQGGSSSVYLAEHKDTKLECALKVISVF